MTNLEAIERIKEHKEIHFKSEPNAIKITEALDIAMSALCMKDELDRPIKNLGEAAVVLCMALGCENCPVVLFDYDKRTEYEKCNLHEPCVSNLFKWITEEALKSK